MRLLPSSFSDADQRRWLLQLLGLLLCSALLLGSIYLYYDYKVRQLEQQRQFIQTQPSTQPHGYEPK